MTQQEVDAHMTKFKRQHKNSDEPIPDQGPESKLASKIKKWADDRGYPVRCEPQTQKLKNYAVRGWPD